MPTGNLALANYTGHDYDAVLEVYFAQARVYAAQDRRFAARDPVKGNVKNTQSFAEYIYVFDNPIRWIDIIGLEATLLNYYTNSYVGLGTPVFYTSGGTAYYPLKNVCAALSLVCYPYVEADTYFIELASTDGDSIIPLELRIRLEGLKEGSFVPAGNIEIYNFNTKNKIAKEKPSLLYKKGQFFISLLDAMNLTSIGGYFKRVSCDKKGNYFFDMRTIKHHAVEQLSQRYSISNAPTWTMYAFLIWQFRGGDPEDSYIRTFKLDWISAYKQVIKDAALRSNIPAFLLAGVSYIEVGGKPTWTDDAAFSGRGVVDAESALKTSFGAVSMQIRVAAETLGYNVATLDALSRSSLTTSLKDPAQNLFISAMHLSNLRDIDFKGITANNMTDEQIAITAERYNRGGGISIDTIRNSPNGYGERILKNKADIMRALQ